MSDHYKISHENIKICNEIITADITSWMQSLKDISAVFEVIANNPKFTGKCANAAREYIREVYTGSNSIPMLLCNIMQAMLDGMAQYENRMIEYDGCENFVLDSARMEQYREDFNKTRRVLYETNNAIKQLLESITDIDTPIGRPLFNLPSLERIDDEITDLNTYLDRIHEDVADIESDEAAFWSEIGEQLINLERLIEITDESGPEFGKYNGSDVCEVLSLIKSSNIKIVSEENDELKLQGECTIETYKETEARIEALIQANLDEKEKQIEELEELQAQRIIYFAENGIDISRLNITDQRFRIVEKYLTENTSEAVSKALVEYRFKEYEGETPEEKILNGLSRIEASEGNASVKDVYRYLKGDITPEMVSKSDYNNYPDSQLYQIALHFMTAENLEGNEMPRWWMEKYLDISRYYVVNESSVTTIMNNTDDLHNYYLGTYCIVDMISGMGNQTDKDGDLCTGQRIYEGLFAPNAMTFEEASFLPWKEYMFGAMYDYVNGIDSIGANKYILTNKMGFPNNTETIGVYSVMTKYPTSLYESEAEAYLSLYNHKTQYYERIIGKSNPTEQLGVFLREDKNKPKAKISEADMEYLESTRNSSFYSYYGCVEFTDLDGIEAMILKDNKDAERIVRDDVNKSITIVWRTDSGEEKSFVYNFNNSKELFNSTYISGEEYAARVVEYAKFKQENNLISDAQLYKYKKKFLKDMCTQYATDYCVDMKILFGRREWNRRYY